MDFTDLLNNYFTKLNCSSKEFSDLTGISPATISRYRNGKSIPDYDSQKLNDLINGIAKVAKEKNVNDFNIEEIRKAFKKTYGNKAFNFNSARLNINELIFELNINKNNMSKSIHFNPTYVSKICTGERKPSNEETFINSISKYIIENYFDEQNKKSISKITGIKKEDIQVNTLAEWITSDKIEVIHSINNFLKKLDEFNLEQYIKSIKFDELKVPTVPFQLTVSKNYYGLDEMRKGELDFFKHTVLSKSKEPIFMYNDMPMEDMAEDVDFGKKWMFAIAMSLKKGLHLNMIHNLDRPFNELMLGLESWIPIYMTGQIKPFYLKTPPTGIFTHTLYVSGVNALVGEGFRSKHELSKYYLTGKKDDLLFYKKKAKYLLDKASPLMDIYTNENRKAFEHFFKIEKANKNNKIYDIENNELNNTFKNIKFTSCKNKWIMITKKTNPEISFVIYHPKLRNAIENFVAPINENKDS